jgi:hypothetical protein
MIPKISRGEPSDKSGMRWMDKVECVIEILWRDLPVSIWNRSPSSTCQVTHPFLEDCICALWPDHAIFAILD